MRLRGEAGGRTEMGTKWKRRVRSCGVFAEAGSMIGRPVWTVDRTSDGSDALCLAVL